MLTELIQLKLTAFRFQVTNSKCMFICGCCVFFWLASLLTVRCSAIAVRCFSKDQTKKKLLRPAGSRTLCYSKWLSSRAVWHPTESDWLRPRQLYRLKLDPRLHVAFVVYPRSVLGDHHRQCRCDRNCKTKYKLFWHILGLRNRIVSPMRRPRNTVDARSVIAQSCNGCTRNTNI